MKVYVTGKYTDKKKIREYMDIIEKLGHTITHDWTSYVPVLTDDELFMGDVGHGKNSEKSSVSNINGISDSDFVVLIMEDKNYHYNETFAELGCALALKKEIVIMCPEPDATCRTNCFFWHTEISRVDHWTDVMGIFDMMSTFS